MTQTIFLSELLAITVVVTAPYFAGGAVLLALVFRGWFRLSWKSTAGRILAAYPIMYVMTLISWALAARLPAWRLPNDLFLRGAVGTFVACVLVTIGAKRRPSPPPSVPAK